MFYSENHEPCVVRIITAVTLILPLWSHREVRKESEAEDCGKAGYKDSVQCSPWMGGLTV